MAWRLDDRFEPTRREFLQVLIGGSTLMIGGVFLTREEAEALPGPGNTSDVADIGDSLVAVEQPYKYNLTLEVTAHNRVRFEMPRQDKGQGIATALAMMIAEEMDADYDRVDVELSDRRSDRPTTITGGSSTIRTMWEPARTVAAHARQALITAAAERWGVAPTELTVKKSMVIHAATGRAANFGELSGEAAYQAARMVPVTPVPLKPLADYTIIGTPRGRKNARAIVTGAQKYTMDLGAADGVPANTVRAVVARPPDIKGRVGSINNLAAVQAMPGVVGVVQIPLPDRGPVESSPPAFTMPSTGVAVAADNFHHALAARDALDITWAPGPMASLSSQDIRNALVSITPALAPGPGEQSLDATFDFPYVAHAALEVMNAVADVGPSSATIWYPSQTPNYQVGQIAAALGIPDASITMHVPFAGGAFGRHLFGESAIEAALISQALARPVKLFWTRNDDMRHGRFRPMTHHALRATWTGATMMSWEHQVAAAEMDLRHGYGDAFAPPGISLTHPQIEQAAFGGTVSVPYEFGVTRQELHNPDPRFEVPTGSWRSIYSGFTMAANEMFVDRLALARGEDDIEFRRVHLVSSTSGHAPAALRCLLKVRDKRNAWGPAPAGHAYGVAVHPEYRSAVAYLVEIDATDPANPRLVRAFAAVDVGIPINPKGLEAQIQGALIDGWSVMISAANHLDNGTIRETSYSDFLWARMNHTPLATEVYVFPADPARAQPGGLGPGGAGELGLPPGSAACVNAYARATGTQPNRFPILEFLS